MRSEFSVFFSEVGWQSESGSIQGFLILPSGKSESPYNDAEESARSDAMMKKDWWEFAAKSCLIGCLDSMEGE